MHDVESFGAFGGSGDDRLSGAGAVGTGSALAHPLQLFGRAGDDALTGGGDDDVLAGGPGNDVLSGGDGSDRLLADPGNDSLDGGANPAGARTATAPITAARAPQEKRVTVFHVVRCGRTTSWRAVVPSSVLRGLSGSRSTP